MEVYKKYGSKERLFEMMKNVNKNLVKESFDDDLHTNQAQFELNLATKMYNILISDSYTPKNDLDKLAIERMMKGWIT